MAADKPLRIYMHAGLPRTATTVLQTHVFPKLTSMRYIGKAADNMGLRGRIDQALFEQLCLRILSGDQESVVKLQRAVPSLLHAMKLSARDKKMEEVKRVAGIWVGAVQTIAGFFEGQPLLYSDESLSESMSGLLANPGYGDMVTLEAIHATGLLRHVSVSMVLREPTAFLKASYYKTAEFLHEYHSPSISFEEYLRIQLAIFERHPPASRIFMCMRNEMIRFYRRIAWRTVFVPHEVLLASNNVIETLFGMPTSEPPVSLAELPRENSTWRNQDVNAFILSAPGVPSGIAIDGYAATFEESIERTGVAKLLADDEARPVKDPSASRPR